MASKIPCPIAPRASTVQLSKDPRGAFTRPRGGTRVEVEARTLTSLYRVHPLCQVAPAPRDLRAGRHALTQAGHGPTDIKKRTRTDYVCG
jgi:hypothetical protein